MSTMVASGLHVSYPGIEVLKGLDLEVPSGTITAVLGPSGCGKTTLLRAIAGFEPLVAGTIHLGGDLVSGPGCHVPPERRNVGVVPQEGALFPHLSVARNVAFGLTGPRSLRRDRVREVLALVGLPDLADRRPAELSGGQQQRVALARALAPNPRLVLLDEPFSALDASLRASVRAQVRDVLTTAGATALLVTHDQDEALSLADQVAVMVEGQVRQSGSPQRVYADPADPRVARILGEVLMLPAEAAAGCAVTPLGELVLRERDRHATGSGIALLRPEQVLLEPLDPVVDPGLSVPPTQGAPADASRTAGTVVQVTYYGHDSTALVRLDDGTGTEVTCRSQAPQTVGQQVLVSVVGAVGFSAASPFTAT
jgi:iron(III) transport system ATP-binding protein